MDVGLYDCRNTALCSRRCCAQQLSCPTQQPLHLHSGQRSGLHLVFYVLLFKIVFLRGLSGDGAETKLNSCSIALLTGGLT